MSKNAPSILASKSHIVCWVREVIYDKGEFVGFLMPMAFAQSIQLYELCTPKIRNSINSIWSKKFDRNSKEGIVARLKLCTNIAVAIQTIHSLNNYVLVDLKPQNILVTPDGKISLIDCDSIQIYQNGKLLYRSAVATQEYTPPEASRLNKDKINQSWDYFSLAIVFYELIFGIHPYTASFKGKYKDANSIDLKIKNGLFVHGNKKGHISVLPSLHENFHIIPKSLRKLFDRAFTNGHKNPRTRPSVSEWGSAIFKEISSNTPKKKFNTNIASSKNKFWSSYCIDVFRKKIQTFEKALSNKQNTIFAKKGKNNLRHIPTALPSFSKVIMQQIFFARGLYFIKGRGMLYNRAKKVYFYSFVYAIACLSLAVMDIKPFSKSFGFTTFNISLFISHIIGTLHVIIRYLYFKYK